jgi:multiple sugar transport system permease protein
MTKMSIFDRVFLSLFVVWSLFPIYWLVGNSMKSEEFVERLPPRWIPDFNFSSYTAVLQDELIQRTLLNSLIVAVLATLVAVALGSLAGFALGQLSSTVSKEFEFWVLSSRMAPAVSVALPFFIIFQAIGINDTLLGLVLAHSLILVGLVTWILVETYRQIPKEIMEAAEIDGCSYWTVFSRVTLPLSRGGVIGAASLSLLLSWNEFFLSLVLSSSDALTVQVALFRSIGYQSFDLGKLAATSIIVVLPTVLIVSLFQKQLISGLTFGAVKG